MGIEQELAADLDKRLNGDQPSAPKPAAPLNAGALQKAIASAREIILDGVVVKSHGAGHSDAIGHQASVLREAIEKHKRTVLKIERERDLDVRALEADLRQARHDFEAHEARLTRKIAQARDTASRRIAIHDRLGRANEAALDLLDDGTGDRRVPRPAGGSD